MQLSPAEYLYGSGMIMKITVVLAKSDNDVVFFTIVK